MLGDTAGAYEAGAHVGVEKLPPKRTLGAFLFGLTLALCVLGVTHRVSLTELMNLEGWDSRVYALMGLHGPFEGGGFTAPFAYRVLFPEAAFLLHADPLAVYAAVWVVSTCFTVAGIILIARRFGVGFLASAAAAALLVLSAPYREGLGDQMVIDAPAMAVSVWSMMVTLQRRYWLLCLLLMAASLNRELSILLAIPALLDLALRARREPAVRRSVALQGAALVVGPVVVVLALRGLIAVPNHFGVTDALALARSVLPLWPVAVTGKSGGWLLALATAGALFASSLPRSFWWAAIGPLALGLAQSVLGTDIPRLILPAMLISVVLAALYLQRLRQLYWIAPALVLVQYASFVNSRLDPVVYSHVPSIWILKYALAIASIIGIVALPAWEGWRRRGLARSATQAAHGLVSQDMTASKTVAP
jgi:hypothetical protein